MSADRDRWPLWVRIAAVPLIAVGALIVLMTWPFARWLNARGSREGDHRGPEY